VRAADERGDRAGVRRWRAGCSERATEETIMKRALIAALLATACGNATGKKEHGMMNCPSDVDGARTTMARTPGGVDLTVTADADDARQLVVMLARVHAAMAEANPEKSEHSGQHGGPGTIGYCPVIHHRTVVTFDEVPHGVTIHVVARSSDDVSNVQLQTAQRLALLPADKR
jgi:hypothetical protein